MIIKGSVDENRFIEVSEEPDEDEDIELAAESSGDCVAVFLDPDGQVALRDHLTKVIGDQPIQPKDLFGTGAAGVTGSAEKIREAAKIIMDEIRWLKTADTKIYGSTIWCFVYNRLIEMAGAKELEEKVAFAIGDKVTHETFGTGIVTGTKSNGHIKVTFDLEPTVLTKGEK
jgi:hypothetical protein